MFSAVTSQHEIPLGRLLSVAGRLLSQHFQTLLDTAGLSPAGWHVLMRLQEEDGLTQRELADLCYVTPATMTGVVDTLEREGMVVRERSADDRRVVRLRLTPVGRRRFRTTKTLVTEQIAPVFEGLSAKDEAVVRRFLSTTIARLSDTDPETTP